MHTNMENMKHIHHELWQWFNRDQLNNDDNLEGRHTMAGAPIVHTLIVSKMVFFVC